MSSVIIMMFIVHVVHVVAMGTRVVIIGNKKPMHPQFSWGTKVAACAFYRLECRKYHQ